MKQKKYRNIFHTFKLSRLGYIYDCGSVTAIEPEDYHYSIEPDTHYKITFSIKDANKIGCDFHTCEIKFIILKINQEHIFILNLSLDNNHIDISNTKHNVIKLFIDLLNFYRDTCNDPIGIMCKPIIIPNIQNMFLDAVLSLYNSSHPDSKMLLIIPTHITKPVQDFKYESICNI